VGTSLATSEGAPLGRIEGAMEGTSLGSSLGAEEGASLGVTEGVARNGVGAPSWTEVLLRLLLLLLSVSLLSLFLMTLTAVIVPEMMEMAIRNNPITIWRLTAGTVGFLLELDAVVVACSAGGTGFSCVSMVVAAEAALTLPPTVV